MYGDIILFGLHFLSYICTWHLAAILAYNTMPGTKSFKKAVHLSVQLLALCLGVIGIWAALKFHNDKGIDNFYSLHSWLGLACLLLFCIQVIFILILLAPFVGPSIHIVFTSVTLFMHAVGSGFCYLLVSWWFKK